MSSTGYDFNFGEEINTLISFTWHMLKNQIQKIIHEGCYAKKEGRIGVNLMISSILK